jgi:hypothetical protein
MNEAVAFGFIVWLSWVMYTLGKHSRKRKDEMDNHQTTIMDSYLIKQIQEALDNSSVSNDYRRGMSDLLEFLDPASDIEIEDLLETLDFKYSLKSVLCTCGYNALYDPNNKGPRYACVMCLKLLDIPE